MHLIVLFVVIVFASTGSKCSLISVVNFASYSVFLSQQIEEKRLRRELAQKEEEVSLQEEKYANIQQEVEVKTKKLKKVTFSVFRFSSFRFVVSFFFGY